MLGREGELEAAGRLIGEPSSRLLGDVRRMIIKDQVDRRMGWIGRVEKLEKLDELTAAMAILDRGVNLTGQQIDAGHQGDRAWRLYSCSRAKVACTPGTGGKSGAVVAMA